MFYDRVAATPDAEAYRFPARGGLGVGDLGGRPERRSGPSPRACSPSGSGREDRVAIASSTRIEWLYADLAVTCAGAATTTVYPTTGAEDVGYILADSGSRIVFAEDDVQVAKLRSQRERLPELIRVVTFDGEGRRRLGAEPRRPAGTGGRHLAEHPTAVDDAVAAVRPEDLATLIYTSGTTGRPKGVELPHRCWTYIGAGAEALDILSSDDLQYLWLPLSHSFGKMLEAVQLQIGFPTAVDGRMDKIVENLAEVRPTFMAGPPRIFEKVHAKIVQTVEEEGGIKSTLFDWAFGVGDQVAQARLRGTLAGPADPAPARVWPTTGAVEDPRPAGRPDPVPRSRAARPSPRTSPSWFYAAGDAGPRGVRADRDQRRGLHRPAARPESSGASARRSPAPRCGPPRTARSSSGARASCAATTTSRRRRPRC